MFCKRAHCALVLMVALAQHYGGEGIEAREVAQTHDLSLVAMNGIVEQLENSGLIIEKEDNKLSLKTPPEKITIWQVVACTSNEEPLESVKRSPRKNKTSVVITINKEDEALQDIISSRLKRYKLSEWSEKANILYI